MEGTEAQLIVSAASPSVVCLTCRILVPVESVFLPKASPLLPPPSPEAVAAAAAALAMAIGSKGRFRAKKWARTGRACRRGIVAGRERFFFFLRDCRLRRRRRITFMDRRRRSVVRSAAVLHIAQLHARGSLCSARSRYSPIPLPIW